MFKRALFTSILILFLLYPSYGNTARVYKGNLFEAFFRDPPEHGVFIFADGSMYSFTSFDETSVKIDIAQIYEFLIKKEKKKIKECLVIIHNHHTPQSFTWRDLKSYYYLKEKGFKGFFCIYYQFNGKVKILDESNIE